jgi:hypothetical protein
MHSGHQTECIVSFIGAVDDMGTDDREPGLIYMGYLHKRAQYRKDSSATHFVSLTKMTRTLAPLLLLSEFRVIHIKDHCLTLRVRRCITDIEERIDNFLRLPVSRQTGTREDISDIYRDVVGVSMIIEKYNGNRREDPLAIGCRPGII